MLCQNCCLDASCETPNVRARQEECCELDSLKRKRFTRTCVMHNALAAHRHSTPSYTDMYISFMPCMCKFACTLSETANSMLTF